MKHILSGLIALAMLAVFPMAAHADKGLIPYKPGALKAAIARGETVLVDYKAVW